MKTIIIMQEILFYEEASSEDEDAEILVAVKGMRQEAK